MDYLYRAEYAKSGRASCRGCFSKIEKDCLRLAIMVQSPMFDGKIPYWYHFPCFFLMQRLRSVDDISHFNSLRWNDQEAIRSKVEAQSSVLSLSNRKRGSTEVPDDTNLKHFRLEYSKSNRTICKGCEQKIMLKEIKIAKRDYKFNVDGKCGKHKQVMWYHVVCFVSMRSKLRFFESADKLTGFTTLEEHDQQEIMQLLPLHGSNGVETPTKQSKPMVASTTSDTKDKAMHDQNKLLFTFYDELKGLKKPELQLLLETNDQKIPPGSDRMIDRLSDIMAFGALPPCSQCHGQLVFHNVGYICLGYTTEWSRCNNLVKKPKRLPFLVPAELANKYSFLDSYVYVARTRIIRESNPTPVSVLETENYLGSSNPYLRLPARSLEMDEMDEMDDMGDLTTVHVKSGRSRKPYMDFSPLAYGLYRSGGIFAKSAKSGFSKVTMKLKNGGAVDPDSGLEDCTHIYQNSGVKYTAVLGLTDIQRQINKYYKLQLLEADDGNVYYLFRSWGRIGTTIGACKVESLSLENALEQFSALYQEKSGNPWENRYCFLKVPGRMYPIDIDYGEEKPSLNFVNTDAIPSKLSKPVQDLMTLIFDVELMKNAMVEFDLDIEKMPLGKLTKAQLQNAYSVLNEMQRLVEHGGSLNALIGASNRFYTYVPHSCGLNILPVIRDLDTIKKKIKMVDNLMELEIAYSVMQSTSSSGKNIIDANYEELKTEIEVLDHETEEFKVIDEYVKNTHGFTHTTFGLEIDEVFVIKREGEADRYKPFSKLHNRKLLWHGSRTTNYVGILSQGLRIAPPEAPSSGYMFGKGIYFADMVSKSANYCVTSSHSNTGLLLLCEVALGEMDELYNAKFVTKLPNGKHSVKGVGRHEPDPHHFKVIPDDVCVPLGKGVELPRPFRTSLIYNEYIVYDPAQVNVKYLVKMNYKYRH